MLQPSAAEAGRIPTYRLLRLRNLRLEICSYLRSALRAGARVVEPRQKLSGTIAELPPKLIRKLLQVFIGRLEVDLETREIEGELRLPSWV